jgi:hypothetical protein
MNTSRSLVMVANAQRMEQEQALDGLYVGLVHQDLTGRWLGIAGFFLPGCTCDPRGVDATERLSLGLRRPAFPDQRLAAWRLTPLGQLPAAVRPRGGWFDDRARVAACLDRLNGGGWRTWHPNHRLPDKDALVRSGRVDAALNNLFFVNSARVEIPEITEALAEFSEELRPARALVSFRLAMPQLLRSSQAD